MNPGALQPSRKIAPVIRSIFRVVPHADPIDYGHGLIVFNPDVMSNRDGDHVAGAGHISASFRICIRCILSLGRTLIRMNV